MVISCQMVMKQKWPTGEKFYSHHLKICSFTFPFNKGKALQHVFNFQEVGPLGISVVSALLTCLGLVLGNEHIRCKVQTL